MHLNLLISVLLVTLGSCGLLGDGDKVVRREMIIFASDRGSERTMNVWMMTPDGTDLRQLTHFTDGFYVPLEVTPDGRSVLLAARPAPGHEQRLYAMPIDGPVPSPDQAIVRGAGIYWASFFPDGRRLLVENGTALQVLDMDTRALEWLQPDSRGLDPEVSPDGTTICYQIGEGRSRQIMMADSDGGNVRALTRKEEKPYVTDCTFTPDGRKVVYTWYGRIAWTDLTTGEEHLAAQGGYSNTPSVNAAGTKVYYRKGAGIVPFQDAEIAVENMDGTGFRLLTRDEFADGYPLVREVEFHE